MGARPGHADAARRRPAATPTGGRPLWSALTERADDHSPAVVEVGGATVSWCAAGTAGSRDLAAGLAAAGRPARATGSPCSCEPSADLTAAVYAVWRAGGVIVVADKGLGCAGMRRALRSAAVDHVIGGAAGLAAARHGAARAADRRRPLPAAAQRALGASARRWPTGAARPGRRAARRAGAGRATAPCVFTSGATGPAKGVVYRHRQVPRPARAAPRRPTRCTAEDRLVAAFAPFALLGPALGIGSAVPDIDVTAPGTLTAAALADAVGAVDAHRGVRLPGRAAQRRRHRRPRSPPSSGPPWAGSGC